MSLALYGYRNLLKTRPISIFYLTASCQETFTPCYMQERLYASRKGKRQKLLAAKMEKKRIEAAKPKVVVPKFLSKIKVSADKMRKRCVDENWLETSPVDNIWRTALYRGKPESFNDAISMHQQTHQPSVINNPEAFVYASVELDLRLKKKCHYLDAFNGVVTFPNEFESGITNKVIALCKTAEDQMKATDAGAVYAGATSVVKQILSGEMSTEDFDYVVCHPDMLKDCNVLRGILKRNYPSAYNNLLRIDVDKAVASFSKGMKYSSECSVSELDLGWVDVCFGRLNMPINSLEENLIHLLKTLEKHKPQGTDDINFITRLTLWCEKSREIFKVPHLEYIPGYQKNLNILDENENDQLAIGEQS